MDRSQILKGSTLCLSGPLVRFSRPETLKNTSQRKKIHEVIKFPNTVFVCTNLSSGLGYLTPQISIQSQNDMLGRYPLQIRSEIVFRDPIGAFRSQNNFPSTRPSNLPSNHHLSWGNRGIPCSDRQPHRSARVVPKGTSCVRRIL